MSEMDTPELEYRLLYSMVVAGKSATFAETAMARFLSDTGGRTPFEFIRALLPRGLLMPKLREARTGNYTKLSRGFADAAQAKIDLWTATPELLETLIHGIGPKTSRFFIIWSRPNEEHAALDTHVLKWLRYLGHNCPRATPSKATYGVWEKVVLSEARRRGMTARELDSAIWDWCSARNHVDGHWPEALQRKDADK